MPWSALPPHINEPHEWNGKDDDKHWYTSWRKRVKGWFAFGPRATEWWARWREYPVVLWAVRSAHWTKDFPGWWRYENDVKWIGVPRPIETGREWYLSRVQYFCDWHIGLQWPLFLHGHYGRWQAYIGFKRDADRVYWLALYLGRVWK